MTEQAMDWKKADDFEEIFEFKNAGDSIQGIFKGMREVKKGDGTVLDSPIVRIKQFDSEKLNDVWASGKIKKSVERLELKDGDFLKIKYRGMVKAKVQDADNKLIETDVHDFVIEYIKNS